MASVGVLFVGAALFVNGLLLLGRVDARGAAIFNLFVGALQTAIPFYLISTASTPDEVLGAAGVFLFGFTYLYVGVNNLAGIPGTGLGWYSAWVSLMAAGFGAVSLVRFDDAATAFLWWQWSVLWATFFVVLGLGLERWTTFTGWLTLVQGFTTCTVPGFLMLLGAWGSVPPWTVAATGVLTLVALAPLAPRRRRDAVTPEPATPASAPVPVAG